MTATAPRYVPAAGRRGLTALYDPVMAVTMRERRFRGVLLRQVVASLPRAASVVDVGCGTGSFAIALARERPDLRVTGVDGDADVLARARRKPDAQLVRWQAGSATSLPLGDGAVQRVVMSLLLHHLPPEEQRRALAEAVRVLAPGGRLHVADWGAPGGLVTSATFFALRALDGFANTSTHAAGRLPDMLTEAGLGGVARHARMRTAWGTLELLAGVREPQP